MELVGQPQAPRREHLESVRRVDGLEPAIGPLGRALEALAVAIELRAIPVSLDSDNNLTVAMSDPSDRHAVDEIAFFTGSYVVRAVATQMQIAWCLAHYYGHITELGERLPRIEALSVSEWLTAATRAWATRWAL